MNYTELVAYCKQRSPLCVGLDPDVNQIPKCLLSFENPILEFCKRVIDATKEYCVAYKPNTAFFEQHGSQGWQTLQAVVQYIPSSHLVIADAKRGDIGNTSERYAQAIFHELKADGITVSPYMGHDSLQPFLQHTGKWTIVLALTSNSGANDFELLTLNNDKKLYEQVLETCAQWGTHENMMFVVGATQPEHFKRVRTLVPKQFLLIPGIGAQGGALQPIIDYAAHDDIGVLINVGRDIIYADSGENFEIIISEKARQYCDRINLLLEQKSQLYA